MWHNLTWAHWPVKPSVFQTWQMLAAMRAHSRVPFH